MPLLQRSWPTWFLRLLHLWRARQVDDLDRTFGGMYRVKPIGFMNIKPLVLIGSLPNKCWGMGTAKRNRRVFTAFHLEWLVYPTIQFEGPSFCSTNFGSVPIVVAINSNTCQNALTSAKNITIWQLITYPFTYPFIWGSIQWEFEKHQLIHYPFSTKLTNHHVLGLARPWSSSDLVTRGGNATISCENPVIFEQ